MTPRGTIHADPNPVSFPEETWWVIPEGPTTLSWSSEGVESVAIRVGDPAGPLVCEGGVSGAYRTASLVDGTDFYLLNTSADREGLDHILDQVTVRVVPGGKLPGPGDSLRGHGLGVSPNPSTKKTRSCSAS